MKKHPEADLEKKAGLGKRFVARLLDGVLVSIVFGIITLALGGLAGAVLQGPDAMGTGIGAAYLFSLFAFPVVYLLYHTIVEATYGYTLGKQVLGMVVTSEDGADLGWGQSIVRNLFRFIGYWLLPLSAILAVIIIAVSDDKQRIGDMAGSTVVAKQA